MDETASRHPGKRIIIHTAASCIDNPGPGGWAAILQLMEGSKELRRKPLKGTSPDTTNNQMELTAAIEALRAVNSGTPVVVRTNCQYVVQGITQWLSGWKANGWRRSDKKPVPNKELWEELDALVGARSVTWERVTGNVDEIIKEVDRLAIEAARLVRWAD